MSTLKAQVFHVPAAMANQTLAAALRQWLAGESWGSVRKAVAGRRVEINGNLCLDAARRLKVGDVVKLRSQPAALPPREDDVRVRYVDAHLVVVEKPAGMTSIRHPEEADWPLRRKQLQPTLDEILPRVLARSRRPKKPGSQPTDASRHSEQPTGSAAHVRVRPVHRLDRDTSGLMVFALSVEAERHLGRQFRRHAVERRYLAIAHGDVPEMRIESRLVRDRGDKRRGSTDLPRIGKLAVTHVRPLERLGGYTLVECRLETGRTHQIRIHLAERGHMLCGEKVYNKPLFGKAVEDASGASRIMLHAAELAFEHPITGERLHFAMKPPADFESFLNRLRRRTGG